MLFDDTTFGSYDKAEHKARKALEFYEDGKMSQALLHLEEALQINPSNSSWHFNKGLTLDSINQFEEAIGEYEIALELCPNDLETLNSLAVDYTRTGQYDLAIDTFEQIQGLDPAFEPCYCNRIITYTEMGQHDLAEQMFYLAQQIDSDCPLCYYNIGNSLFVRGKYKRAIHCWLRTVELAPSHPQINYRIAQAYWSGGDNEHAREYFLAELRANPGDVDVILDFGLFLLEIEDVDSAKEKFNRILELRPDSAEPLFYLGEIAFNNADYTRAVQLFNEAIQEDNTLAGPRYRLAQCALMSGQKQKGRDYLVSEVELAVDNTDALVSIGSMFLIIGELDLATHCLLRAVDLERSCIGSIEDVCVEPFLQKAARRGPAVCANADAYYYLGLVSAGKEELEDAAEFFGHTLDINPEHVPALRDSAIVYLAMGRTDDAAERIKKAKALAGDDSHLKAIGRRLRLVRLAERIKKFPWCFRP